jgi:hypothetical protein
LVTSWRAHLVIVLAVVGSLLPSCRTTRDLPPCREPAPTTGPKIEAAGDPVVVGAGDIALASDIGGAEATAKLLDTIDGHVITFGDNAYENATLDDYLDAFHPTWGRHRWRMHPSLGNHEYNVPHAAPYFAYFCDSVGETYKGWYSYDIGSWHFIVLNSNCAEPDANAPACDRGSEQERWLRADLAAHPAKCTAAYWHHPRFCSGSKGDDPTVQDLWQALYEAGADVVLSGHAHVYERFGPQDPTGHADPERGIREFVVGTGGADLSTFNESHANSEARKAGLHGVIKLTLHAASYDWQFITVDNVVQDSGQGVCH